MTSHGSYFGMSIRLEDGAIVRDNTDRYGNVIERTKEKYPYSYSTYVQYQADEKTRMWAALDTSRVYHSGSEGIHRNDKYDFLAQKYFGNIGHYWNQRSPEAITGFLQEFHTIKSLTLLSVRESCNASNGYPYWNFKWLDEEK